ncbi:hypothetical protein EPI10_033288 [Gossypium australe]|uniref:Uncharacterized protein n=1 Tax=Gossypium australe TaxID=47621 RepID=A0A5B6X775_9ROSI|nr:hypothetical protein EPI10_033288 [Gossypium australe]
MKDDGRYIGKMGEHSMRDGWPSIRDSDCWSFGLQKGTSVVHLQAWPLVFSSFGTFFIFL